MLWVVHVILEPSYVCLGYCRGESVTIIFMLTVLNGKAIHSSKCMGLYRTLLGTSGKYIVFFCMLLKVHWALPNSSGCIGYCKSIYCPPLDYFGTLGLYCTLLVLWLMHGIDCPLLDSLVTGWIFHPHLHAGGTEWKAITHFWILWVWHRTLMSSSALLSSLGTGSVSITLLVLYGALTSSLGCWGHYMGFYHSLLDALGTALESECGIYCSFLDAVGTAWCSIVLFLVLWVLLGLLSHSSCH